MSSDLYISRQALARRWGTSIRTVDRLRLAGKIPWHDIAAGRGARPLVRFALLDILDFEAKFRQAPQVGESEATNA